MRCGTIAGVREAFSFPTQVKTRRSCWEIRLPDAAEAATNVRVAPITAAKRILERETNELTRHYDLVYDTCRTIGRRPGDTRVTPSLDGFGKYLYVKHTEAVR